MKKIYAILGVLTIGAICGCSSMRAEYETEQMYGLSPRCLRETTIAVYDKDGMHTYPGCAEFDFSAGSSAADFPQIPNNKYDANQVVMENLNTRVLAYCRGSVEEIESCVETLENSCYIKVSDIPKLPAKHDFLQTGTYPTRRWRNGDAVSRW